MHNTTMLRLATLAAIGALACLAACSGNGRGLDAGGRPLGSGGAAGGPLTADFDSIQANVFTPICTVCHAGGAAPQGLRLDATSSYSLLVGVPSHEVSSLLRVAPGDPDHSYLVQKLEGHAAVGAQMPFGGPPLPAATIAVIRQWITDGALPAPAGAAVARFAVVATAPADRDVVFESPNQIIVGFNAELDQTRLDATSIRLERRVLGSAPEFVPVTLSLARGAPSTLLIAPRTPLVDGRYRLVVPEPPETGLAGIGGQRLLPAPGGTLVSEFDVVVQP
jgi:hypothetical protein